MTPTLDRQDNRADFPEPRVLQDQVFIAVSAVPYTRKDGGQTRLVTWQSRCPTCNETFENVTSIAPASFEPQRRCDAHRRPGVPAAKDWRCRILIDAEPRQPVVCEAREHTVGIVLADRGALALVSKDHQLVDVLDLPLTDDGPRMRPHVDGARLSAIIRAWKPAVAILEIKEVRSSDTALAATARGLALGIIEGVCTANDVAISRLQPSYWRRLAGLPLSLFVKNAARHEAVATWPMRAEWFQHVNGEQRAEAALLAVAGSMRP